jgi:hypothetical protein
VKSSDFCAASLLYPPLFLFRADECRLERQRESLGFESNRERAGREAQPKRDEMNEGRSDDGWLFFFTDSFEKSLF